jgi:hypothetical protein
MPVTTERPATERSSEGTAIRPFAIDFPQAEIETLSARIASTRWPERETVTDDSQGVPLATMQELAHYWGGAYDWRKCEQRLRALPHFITELDGLDIHFIHVRSQHEDALPMIVTHRSADQPHRSRGERSGRFPRRDSLAARLRVLRQAGHDRVGSRPHRARVGGADEAPWIRPVRGARWRLGRGRHAGDG